jgi:hypothetical protein
MQLVGYEKKKPRAFQEDNALKELMRLANVQEGIARRVLTLWGNDDWKKMITTCCGTAVGSYLFNVSRWTDLSRYRVDDVSGTDAAFVWSQLTLF